MPLLRRGICRLVVFINTCTPLSMSPVGSFDTKVAADAIDMYLPPLFGVCVEELNEQEGYYISQGMNVANNQVFANDAGEFCNLVTELQRKKRDGLPVTATCSLTTVPNKFWGLKDSIQVDVLFVYLEDSETWRQQLDPETCTLLDSQEDLANFPHYNTVHQNSGLDLLSLTATQAFLSHCDV